MASSRSTSGEEPRAYGFQWQGHPDEVLWLGEFDVTRLTYVGVARVIVASGAHSTVTLATPRKHLVWAKDELEAYTRLMARREDNV